MLRRLGDDMASWRWESVHAINTRHPLSLVFPEIAESTDPSSVGMPGDADTPLASACLGADPAIVTNAPVARYVFDTSDWDSSTWVVPLGSSGHPASGHYRDQAGLWAALQMIPMSYTWEKVFAGATSQQTLTPTS